MDPVIAVPEASTFLLVANGKIVQSKRLRMAEGDPFGTPFCVRTTVRKFNQIQRIVDPRLHFIQRHSHPGMRIIACRKHRNRLRAQVFTKLKELVIPQSKGLMPSPANRFCRTFLHRSKSIFPSVHGIAVLFIQRADMHGTAARKAQKPRFQFRDHFCQIISKPILMAAERIAGEQGDKIKRKLSCRFRSDEKPCCFVGLSGANLEFTGFPLPGVNLHRFSVKNPALLRFQRNVTGHAPAASCRKTKTILLPCKNRNPGVKAGIADPCLSIHGFKIHDKMMGIFRVYRILRLNGNADL